MPSANALFALLALVVVNTKMIRSAIPPLVPFIASSVGYSTMQSASLLGAFFPGYLLTQVPAGWCAQRFGAKLVVTTNIVGTALLFSLIPAMAHRSASPLPVAGILTAMGLCQGGLIPAEAAIKHEWLAGMHPGKRAWMQGILGFAHQLCHLLATWATPRLASGSGGWTRVCSVYGATAAAAALLWQSFAASSPSKAAVGRQTAGKGEAVAAKQKEKPHKVTVEWAVFSTRSVLGIMSCQMAYNVRPHLPQ